MVKIHLHFGLIQWENAFQNDDGNYQNDGNHQNHLNDSCFTSMKSMIKLAIKLINQNKQLNWRISLKWIESNEISMGNFNIKEVVMASKQILTKLNTQLYKMVYWFDLILDGLYCN